MADLAPSNEVCRQRLEELEAKLRRVDAVTRAISGLCSLLPAALPEASDVQTLVAILAEAAPAALADVGWLVDAAQKRTVQIAALLSISAA